MAKFRMRIAGGVGVMHCERGNLYWCISAAIVARMTKGLLNALLNVFIVLL